MLVVFFRLCGIGRENSVRPPKLFADDSRQRESSIEPLAIELPQSQSGLFSMPDQHDGLDYRAISGNGR